MKFEIKDGPLHKGGTLVVELLSVDQDNQTMSVQLKYEISKKALVPVPSKFLNGSFIQLLPSQFENEIGYLRLEAERILDLEKVTVEHLGRTYVNELSNGHLVRITTKKSKSEVDIYYHPELPELGWGEIRLLIRSNLPMIGDYELRANLK